MLPIRQTVNQVLSFFVVDLDIIRGLCRQVKVHVENQDYARRELLQRCQKQG